MIKAYTERNKFVQAVNFLSDLINFPHITTEKVNTTAWNMLNKIPALTQSAIHLLRALDDGLYFNNASMIHHSSFLRQKKILEGVLETIKTDPGSVTEDLYQLIRTLASPENTFLYIATDTKKLIKQYGPDLSVLGSLLNVTTNVDRSSLVEQFDVKSDYEYRKVDRNDEVPKHMVYGVGETESCHLLQSYWYNLTDWTSSEVYKLYTLVS